ncbi:MAG: ribonuclease D [Oceanospirillaceae bacterium]|jgi:ribonuclease D
MLLDYQYIDTNEGLKLACQTLIQAPAIAVDTEFVRVDTFYPIPGLVQLAAAGETFLVDPLTIDDWVPLQTLLTDPDTLKVMHACSEDLELFQNWLELRPTPMADTQIAAAFVDMGLSPGYQSLVLDLLGEIVDKGETRSDWLHRPLRDSQCHYAAMDVAHLMQCYDILAQRLKDKGVWQWFLEDMQRLAQPKVPIAPEMAYTQMKNAWRLQGKAVGRLRALAAWREGVARSENRPKNFVVKDSSLIEMARTNPVDLNEIGQCQDMRPSSLRRYGKQWLSIMLVSSEVLPGVQQPLSKNENADYKRLHKVVTDQAENAGVQVQLMGRKKELLELFEGLRKKQPFTLPNNWQGWRAEFLVEAITIEYNHIQGAL